MAVRTEDEVAGLVAGLATLPQAGSSRIAERGAGSCHSVSPNATDADRYARCAAASLTRSNHSSSGTPYGRNFSVCPVSSL